MNFWDEKETKRLFQEFPFYDASVEKQYTKRLNSMYLLHEKESKAFKEYSRSYKIDR